MRRGAVGLLAMSIPIAIGIAACVGDDPSTATGDDSGTDSATFDGSPGTDSGDAGQVIADGSTTVVDVSFGYYNSCALLADGTVWCWGDDGLGQLGVPTASLPDVATCANCRPTPAPMPGLSNVKQISAGQQSCAVDKVGDVYCWGQNSHGELGHASGTGGDTACAPSGSECNPTPSKVAGIADVTKVAVGGNSVTCALTTGHLLYCWGSNQVLAVDPDAAAPDTATPTLVAGFTGETILDFDLPLNGVNVCAVVQGKGIYCWGFNEYGQTGHNPFTAGDLVVVGGNPASPLPAQFVTATTSPPVDCLDVVQLAAVQNATCGTTADAGVKCWGNNQNGEFGNQSFPGSHSVNDVLRSNAADIAHLSGRGGNSQGAFCGLTTDGHIMCWGPTDYGQLGNGVDTSLDASAGTDAGTLCTLVHCADTPQPIAGSMTFTKLSVGWLGAMALGTDGHVYAWGINVAGQLGHAPLTNGDDGACVNPGSPDNGLACNSKPSIVNGLP